MAENYPYVTYVTFDNNKIDGHLLVCEVLQISPNNIINENGVKYYVSTDYKIHFGISAIAVSWRFVNRNYISNFMHRIARNLGHYEYNWNVYDIINKKYIPEFNYEPNSSCKEDEYICEEDKYVKYMISDTNNNTTNDITNDTNKNEDKFEDKPKTLEEMDDIDIHRYLISKGDNYDPYEEYNHWHFEYDPTNPCLNKFSYGIFKDCTIPCRSFQFTEEEPYYIRGAYFYNVDFSICQFHHVVFLMCHFDNCDFSKAAIQTLTFDRCSTTKTNLSYPNVTRKLIHDLDIAHMC